MVVLLTALALGLRVYRMRYGYAHAVVGYDDGVYLGSALHLVHGDLPYRDYVLVHPPLITVLLTPVALLAKVIGTAQAMGLAKLLTAFAGAAGVPLVARLLWHRGRLPAVLAAAVLALHDDAVASAYGLLLEPWLVLFCLLAINLVFVRGRLADGRRLWWGGVVFGLACATKIWAFALVLAVVLVCLPHTRRALRYVAGVAVGFLVPVLPFALAAPGGFVHQVFAVQLLRNTQDRTSVTYRLLHLFAVGPPTQDLPGTGRWLLLSIAAAVGISVAVLGARTARAGGTFERFAVVGAALVTAMMFVPGTFYWHYAAFAVPFLAIAAVLPLAPLRPRAATAWTTVLALCVAGLAFTMLHRDLRSYSLADDHRAFAAAVPAGSCVVTTMSSVTIADERFAASVAGCPVLLDSVGTALAHGHGAAPTPATLRDPGLVRVWSAALRRADFVLLVHRDTPTFPPRLQRYLREHFRLVDDPGLRGELWRRVPGA